MYLCEIKKNRKTNMKGKDKDVANEAVDPKKRIFNKVGDLQGFRIHLGNIN